ncbi:MAG: hypothetical protein N2C14_08840, partial [Planctomycetales bacterium]
RPANARFETRDKGTLLIMTITATDAKSPLVAQWNYQTSLPADLFPKTPVVIPPEAAKRLDAVPGFEATRLSLNDAMMPTGLAWRPDGALVIASLEGRAWLARDSDSDGLEDVVRPFSDELAAPYGTQTAGDAVDVITKYALLRLTDSNGDGFADRVRTLASGWGHTQDYHDWAVGLPRDKNGNYYVAFPCQQDGRDLAAARLRGRAIRLVPPPSSSDQRFRVEEFCAGLRFPMGLALNRQGELFASDNQGNWNPFNELNHLQAGKRYGFINKVERKDGFAPPLTPPSINIPHPWTRSVNGIVFLDTPDAVEKKLGRPLYGPFEGHLVGCEYDTRRLIRMSLERIDGVYQGAAYPFSATPNNRPGFQGPICCAIAPDGDVYVGNIRDSGWGGGSNVGSVVRMKFTGNLPPGIAEARAAADGFHLSFTTAMNASHASAAGNYHVSSYRRTSTPAYGGEDQDRRVERIRVVQLASDGKGARLILASPLATGRVYEIRVKSPPGVSLHPAEAHYTLRRIPNR